MRPSARMSQSQGCKNLPAPLFALDKKDTDGPQRESQGES